MDNFKFNICKDKECNNKFKQYSSLNTYCSPPCKIKNQKAAKPQKSYKIPKVGDKRKIQNLKYSAQRVVFLGKAENKICPITKWPTTDVHHKKGRIGDLLLDEKHWIALSREGHNYVEDNPEWAKENGYSLDRLSR